MFHLIRSVNYGIINILIGQAEEVSDRYDDFSENSSYFFRNRQFQRIFGCNLKEFAHCFVCSKPFYNGKNVILQRCQGCSSNLRSKVIGLAFAQAQQSLGFLKYDFQRPPLGINPTRLQEIELGVGCHQSVPNSVLAPFDKEQSYIGISKDYVCHDIMTAQFPAISLFLTFGKKLYQSRCNIRLTIEAIFCLAVFPNFNHS